MQMLFLAWEWLPAGAREECLATMDALVDLAFPSGNFPSSAGRTSDKLVQFCHGGPGIIPVLLAARAVCAGDATRIAAYTAAAVRAGHDVYRRGILCKGVGLCHGIAGNAFALLALFRATEDELWLARAEEFAGTALALLPELQDVPDDPLSLFNGLAGLAALLSALDEPRNATFPAFEL